MKKITIITRHPETQKILRDFFENDDVQFEVISHLEDIDTLGDIVVGILPVPLIKKILETGRKFYLFTLNNIPPEKRGKELSKEEIEEIGYEIFKIEGIEMKKI